MSNIKCGRKMYTSVLAVVLLYGIFHFSSSTKLSLILTEFWQISNSILSWDQANSGERIMLPFKATFINLIDFQASRFWNFWIFETETATHLLPDHSHKARSQTKNYKVTILCRNHSRICLLGLWLLYALNALSFIFSQALFLHAVKPLLRF